jgi:hypothetical protein
MTWTYALALNENKDKVRLLLGDTDVANPGPIQDEEIAYFLAETSNDIPRSAIRALLSLAAQYSGNATTVRVGETTISRSERAGALRDRAKELADLYGIDLESDAWVGVAPYVGGLSRAEAESDGTNTDLPQPAFTRGMHDYRPGRYPWLSRL